MMDQKQPITAGGLRVLADALQDEAQRITDYLDGCGLSVRELAERRRLYVDPRLAAAGALRNAATKIAAIRPTVVGDM